MAQHGQYWTCPVCGSNNDHGEPCECSKWDKPGHEYGAAAIVKHDPDARRRYEAAIAEWGERSNSKGGLA
jgi:hypothetical protein